MEFLSNLTLVQRAGGAAVLILVLVLLLVKQRQGQGKAATAGGEVASVGKPAKVAKTRKGSTSRKSKPAKAEKKGKAKSSFGRGRGRKSDAGEPPVAEPKATQGRMVPRLPSPVGGSGEGEQFDALTDPLLAELTQQDELGEAGGSGIINEPGWPSGPESWSAPAPVPAAEPVAHEDALDALATPPVDDAGWSADDDSTEFDPATGWAEETPEPDTSDDGALATGWDTADEPADEKFDWNAAEETIAGWETPGGDAPEVGGDDAEWASEADTGPVWTAVAQDDDAPTAAPAAEDDEASVWAAPDETTPLAWDPNAIEEPVEEDEPIDELVATDWTSVDGDAVAPDATDEDSPEFIWEPVAEDAEPIEALSTEHRDIAIPAFPAHRDELAPELVPVSEAIPELASVTPIETAAFVSPVVEVEPAPVAAPIVETPDADAIPEVAPIEDAFVVEPAAALVIEPVADEASVAESIPAPAPVEITPEPMAFEPSMEPEVTTEAPLIAAATINPVERWASMSPAGTSREVAPDPVTSWSRMRPSTTVAPLPTVERSSPSAVLVQEPAISAPSVAWWDVPTSLEADPRRGRFALGGYALQGGHQVVSGVTFRDGVVPPPDHWVIGPVVGAVAPGTLILEVDGLLNCHARDLSVLMDQGFAPTTEGFSLRLLAAAQGPFAASGTYRIS